MLIETFPDLPAFCRIPTEERRQAWAGIELRPSCGTITLGRTVIYDPSTEQVRLDAEARQAQRREAELLKKRDAEAVRKRGIKNVKILALAIAGKVRLPPEPVKIVRVLDLNPLGREPATKETTMMKKRAKQNPKLPATHPANRGPKRRTKAKARRASGPLPSPSKRAAGTKVDVVQKIADMMAASGGASMAEMVKATGIEPHPMRAKIKLVRDRLGYTTEAPSAANGKRYSAKPPAKKTEG